MNRRGLKKNVKNIFKKALIHQYKVGLLLVNLDHFKQVNDTFGNGAGDYFLKKLTKRLVKTLGNRTLIARLGGDEFAIVIKHLEKEQLLEIGQIIMQQLEMPISYKGRILTGGMSIGCAVFPDDANTFSDLLKCADTALNDLKMRGRGGIRYFGKDMLSLVKNKAKQIETARFIIREKLIKPFYQPKINLKTNKLAGVEALLRWYDKEGLLHMPDSVHEAFSDFELSSRISEIMQVKIFEDIKKWQKYGKQVVPVAINASPVEFLRDNYAETLLERIHSAHIDPENIEVEITEHLFTDDGMGYVVRALNKLRRAGVKIALDDFGTGHSSLSHLRDLPVDAIKIDYSFIELMEEDPSIRAIVEGIIKLGPLLSIKIIAEGIENKQQLKLLKDMGCHEGQGFLFNQAMNQFDMNDILKNK